MPPAADEKRFGALLKAKRTEQGLTLAKVAEQVGVSISYLHDVEAGRRAPFASDRIRHLAKILKCSSLGLCGAAAISNGYYELPVRDTKNGSHKVGSLLQSRWLHLTPTELVAIEKTIAKKEKKT